MEYGLVIAALTKLYEAARAGDWDTVEKIVFVIVLGGVVGFFNIQGITLEQGMIGSLATSGVFTGIGYIAKKARMAMWPELDTKQK